MLLLLSLLGSAAAARPPLTAAKRPVYPVRSSSVKFWAGDLSCGAGALSSPVREEHPRDAAEIAVYAEGKFARMCTWFPRWLLLSALGIISRELASRQVREYLVPSALTPIAQPKAKALSVALRKNLDSRVTKVLSGGNFRELSSLSGIVDRVVQAELEELEGMITSVEDLLRNEMTRSIVEVVEAEVGERVVETLDTVVQLNETESSGELSALLRAAGKGQDGTVTLDDIYTLVAGEGALRIPEVSLLMQQVPLLKGDQIQQTKLERWFASPKRPLRPSASPRHLFYIPCAPLQVVARHRAVARPAAARGRDCARRRRVEPRPARRPAATERVQPPLQPGRWSRRGDDDLRGELDARRRGGRAEQCRGEPRADERRRAAGRRRCAAEHSLTPNSLTPNPKP